ncbi:MAG: hypothetical protein CMK72_12290 [Pseudomonadaceae bacterium]|nr:hypothetical protein [Pseudomonadaceae bacterium]OEO25777.1 hypothetical protein AX279_10090 [Pseudomonas sp. J237]HCP53682.1 hypothetical protein [Pseudomonas sp.]|tara:strand:+ start:1020 stop:1208 length:189 start_codon:yes stop_codon:yes gene_type:complete
MMGATSFLKLISNVSIDKPPLFAPHFLLLIQHGFAFQYPPLLELFKPAIPNRINQKSDWTIS